MDPSISNGGREAGASRTLTPESLKLFTAGIPRVLRRWTSLQMAIAGQWGGSRSLQKSHDLASSILSWFSNSNWFSHSEGPLSIYDLEKLLSESMALLFRAHIADDSVAEVAGLLMVIHEECLKGNYESIDELMKSVLATDAVSHSRWVIHLDEDESSDEEES